MCLGRERAARGRNLIFVQLLTATLFSACAQDGPLGLASASGLASYLRTASSRGKKTFRLLTVGGDVQLVLTLYRVLFSIHAFRVSEDGKKSLRQIFIQTSLCEFFSLPSVKQGAAKLQYSGRSSPAQGAAKNGRLKSGFFSFLNRILSQSSFPLVSERGEQFHAWGKNESSLRGKYAEPSRPARGKVFLSAMN